MHQLRVRLRFPKARTGGRGTLGSRRASGAKVNIKVSLSIWLKLCVCGGEILKCILSQGPLANPHVRCYPSGFTCEDGETQGKAGDRCLAGTLGALIPTPTLSPRQGPKTRPIPEEALSPILAGSPSGVLWCSPSPTLNLSGLCLL